MSITARIGSATAALVAGAMVIFTGAPAQAVDPGTVATAVKTAYDAYQKFFGNQLTLEQATSQIISAIDSARTEIEAHLDLVAAAQVRACAHSAIIDLADIRVLSPDTLQAFARDATDCVTLGEALLDAAGDKGAVDQLGFAVNAVGPIALLARAYAGFSTPLLKSTLISADNTVIAKLTPSCFATPLWGDAEPGGPVEFVLRCTAYTGQVGYDSVVRRIRRGQPLPPFDYTFAISEAMAGTSYPVAQAALPVLNS